MANNSKQKMIFMLQPISNILHYFVSINYEKLTFILRSDKDYCVIKFLVFLKINFKQAFYAGQDNLNVNIREMSMHE